MVRNSARMETTFYDEQAYHNIGDVNQLKRNLTLDLNQTSQRGGMKRQKMNNPQTPLLSSPDLNMLKLGTPELEKLIIAQQSVPVTPTTQILFPRSVTEAQEMYARGFVDALNELHNSDSSQGGTNGTNGLQAIDLPVTTSSGLSGGITYTNLDQQSHPAFSLSGGGYHHNTLNDNIVIKDEPQTVPSIGSTPPLSPIDMECQERIKLERKRQRNRVAASKCRRRKLERISRLEEKVKLLKGENSELSSVVNKLKQHVCNLKEQVMEHVQAGCQIMPQGF